MVRVAICLVVLALTGGNDGEARPCSPPCGVHLVVPAGGEVPANLPALRWWYSGPSVNAGEVVRVTETLEDGSTNALPIERDGDGLGGNYARFGRSLVPGASYIVEVANGCASGTPYVTSTFRAVAEAPLPTSLGVIAVAERSFQSVRQVWTSSGSCTNEAIVVARELELTLSESAMPWRNAIVANWYHGGYFVSLLGEVFDMAPSDPEAYWEDWTVATPYHTCASEDRGIDPGAPEGSLEIVVRATIPGSDHIIPEVTATIELVCDDAENRDDPMGARSGGAGCASGQIGCAALMLLAILRLGRLKRAGFQILTMLGCSTVALFVPSCESSPDGPVSEADSDVVPHEVSSAADDVSAGPTCSFTEWRGPDSPKLLYSCAGRASGGFDCSCDGAPVSIDVVECERAILEACGVSRPEREFCDYQGRVCWPGSSADEWLCRCAIDARVYSVVADNCSIALFGACASTCENPYGACAPRRDEDFVFDCICHYYSGFTRTLYGMFECQEALYRCVPQQGSCENFAGFCDRRPDGFTCGCLDGEASSPSYAALGHDDCREVLTDLCGDPGPPPEVGCSDERVVDGVTRTGTCTLLPDGAEEAPGQVYKCSCKWNGSNQSGASGYYSAETDCAKALEMCFP